MAKSTGPTPAALRQYERARAAGMSVEDAASLLTPAPRPKRVRETDEYLRDLTRLLRAAGRRVADADGPELKQLLELMEVLDEAATVAVAGQLSRNSWAWVAEGVGVRRQSLHEKYAAKVKALENQA